MMRRALRTGMCHVLFGIALFRQGMAQIPVEVFAGNRQATFDLMFFRFLESKSGANSPWLFFNRNRAAAEYPLTSQSLFPRFGFTEAFSYNRPELKGFAPVVVGQIFSNGIFSKTGFQFARSGADYTVFTWLVSQTRGNPELDLFLLLRYTPAVSDRLHLFSQFEGLWTAGVEGMESISLTLRGRAGVSIHALAFGAALDALLQRGAKVIEPNSGLFLRYNF